MLVNPENRVVIEAHLLCRPLKPMSDELVRVALPNRVARMYLEMEGEWGLPPLAGTTRRDPHRGHFG